MDGGMNREQIIRMAREAGIISAAYDAGFMDIFTLKLERFATLVAAAEREACAKVVEASPSYDWHRFACEAAAAIRARGQSTPDCPPCHGDCNQGRTCPARTT